MTFLLCHDVTLLERNGDCSDKASFNDLTGRSIAVASRTGGMSRSYTYEVAAKSVENSEVLEINPGLCALRDLEMMA